jgi:hypothetical protein
MTTPTITFSDVSKNILDLPFTISASTNPSGLPLTYSSSNTSVISISGNTATVVGLGSSTITAAFAGDSSYNSTSTTATFTVSKATPTITFSDVTKTYGDSPFTINASSPSDGVFIYSSSNRSVIDISGNTATVGNAGNAIITVTQQPSTDNVYGEGLTTAIFTVQKATPTITFSDVTKTYGDSPFTISASTNPSGLPLTYSSSNTSVIDICGNTATVGIVGSSTITATFAGNSNYSSTSTTATFTVQKATPTITFSDVTKTYGNSPFTISASTNPSGLPLTYSSSNTSVIDICGNTATVVGYGFSTITASFAGNSNYNSTSTTATFTVSKATPTITFSAVTKTYGESSFALSASTNPSGLPLRYTSFNTSVISITGTTATVVGYGSATITATFDGDSNYSSKSQNATFTVQKATPTILFSDIIKTILDTPFPLSAIITPSELTSSLTYSSSNTSVIRISGTTATVVGLGSATITATFAGNSNYNLKSQNATFTVIKATPIISFNNVNKTIFDTPFTISASSNSNGAFSYFSNNLDVIRISENTATVYGVGVATITAILYETTNYTSYTATATFTVSSNLSVPICFPAGTPVLTDQGTTAIDKIDLTNNTIRGKKIVAITKTVTIEDKIVCIEKDALAPRVPSQKTLISRNHKLLYNKQMTKAKHLVGKVDGVYNKKYNGEILYNVLLETHEKMLVNNLIVETLDPENIVAKLYNGNYTDEEKNNIIVNINQCADDYKKVYGKIR